MHEKEIKVQISCNKNNSNNNNNKNKHKYKYHVCTQMNQDIKQTQQKIIKKFQARTTKDFISWNQRSKIKTKLTYTQNQAIKLKN